MPSETWESESKYDFDELTKEKELLHLQLHQAQEELEYYFRKYQEIAGGKQSANNLESIQTGKFNDKSSSKIVLDLRQLIDGENWYSAEHDGRWAGPGTNSTLRLPLLPVGRYQVELEVVDAIAPEILREMKLSLNGKPLTIKGRHGLVGPWAPVVKLYRKKQRYPLLLRSDIHLLGDAAGKANYLELTFPRTISPISRGVQDSRNLAVRLKKVTITRIVERNAAADSAMHCENQESQIKELDRQQRARDADDDYVRFALDLEQKELEIQLLSEQVKGKDEIVQSLKEESKRKDMAIQSLEGQVKKKAAAIQFLEGQVKGKDMAIQSLEGQVKGKDQVVQSLEGQVKGKDMAIQSLEGQIKEKDQVVQSLERQVKEADQTVESLKEQINRDGQVIQSLDEQVKEKEKTIQSLEVDFARAQQTVNLTSKMASLRESDLIDLRQRYKEVLQTQEQQHQLLSQLEERLHTAANYFHRLSDRSKSGLVIEHKGKQPDKKKKKRK